MGAVYVAQDTQLGDRLVAIKEMSMSRLAPHEIPQAVEQFKHEAHLLGGLHHPNLPVIHEYFGEENRWYLVMSFIQGETLHAHLNAMPTRRLPVTEVVSIGIELCTVLDYLHSHQPQIVFRDLKPQNIMITPGGQIYLIDFGIARHFKQDQGKDTAYYFSNGYAPPEQYGESQTGPRSDIYSLGVTLHQMLSGHDPTGRPFHFPSLQMLDPTLPVTLTRLIMQMLELDEKNRPASAAAVKQELQKSLGPSSLVPTQFSQAPLPQKNWLARALTSLRVWRVFGSALLMIAGIVLCLQFRVRAIDAGLNEAPYILLVGGLSLALAGLTFLLPANPALSTGKGMLLVLAGSLLLLPIYRDASASDGVSLLNYNSYQPWIVACLIICTALASLGAFWIWRHANLITGIVFGSLVAILGIIFLLQSDTAYIVPYVTQFITDPYQPNLGLLSCVGQILLGVVTPFIIGLRQQGINRANRNSMREKT